MATIEEQIREIIEGLRKAAEEAGARESRVLSGEEVHIVHDEECAETLTFGGCCKHYCPTGEHVVE